MSPAVVFDTLLEASARAVLVAGFVAIALVVFRAKAPALRHAVWTAALAIMLVLPLTSGWLPTMQIPLWLPAPALERLATVSRPASVVPDPIPASPATPPSSSAPIGSGPVLTPAARVASARPVTMASGTVAQDWRTNLVLVWAIVTGVLLLREALGWRLAQRLAAQGVPAAIGDGTFESERVTTPVVTGVLRPRVLVPESWPGWGSSVRRMVLAHERAHVTRRDPLVAALARVNRSIFWFHPLAWWMERHLSRLAERACDEVVVRELKDSRLYAALLVEMAHRLQRHGHRVAWQGIGIVSSRPFEDRIDRILDGPAPNLSRRSKAALAVACAVLMVIGVACGTAATPLAEDPELAKEIASRTTLKADYEAMMAMTLDQVAELEKVAAANPDDLAATEKLIGFYRQRGHTLMRWHDLLAARRPHQLRMIERHPESFLASWPYSRRADPEGYEQARTLWMAHVQRPGVTAATLGQAALFFEKSEKPLAEELLLKANAMDPGGPTPRVRNGIYQSPWPRRLGQLYAMAIVGSDDQSAWDAPVVNAELARSPFARAARQKLEESSDPVMLVGAAAYLYGHRGKAIGLDARALSLEYAEKARQLNSDSKEIIRILGGATHDAEYQRMAQRIGQPFSRFDEAEFDQLSDGVKMEYGHQLLWMPYNRALLAYQAEDEAGATAALEDLKRRTDVIAALTASAPRSKATALLEADLHIAFATHAWHQGSRRKAVSSLANATNALRAAATAATSSAAGPAERGHVPMAATHLTYDLLTAGERESVAAYYDAAAISGDDYQRRTYQAAAAAIRAGKMPAEYQRYLAQRK